MCCRRPFSSGTPNITSDDDAGSGHELKPWHVLAAVCLERMPTIAPKKLPIEAEYSKMIDDVEVEESLLSDHEMRQRQEETADQRGVSLTGEEVIVETTADIEGKWTKELDQFEQQRQAAGKGQNELFDAESEMRSISRKLDRKLYLIVKERLGRDFVWLLPQGAYNSQVDSSLRDTAERILSRTCGASIEAQFFGNAPIGFYKYKYPKKAELREHFIGAKVFFFHAQHRQGIVEPDAQLVHDYMWVTRPEMGMYLPQKYYEKVEKFLFELHAPSPISPEAMPDELAKLRF